MLLNSLLTLVALPALALTHSLPAKTLRATPSWYMTGKRYLCDPVLEELVSIPAINGILGIAQVPKSPDKPETFVVVGSNATGLNQLIPGTFGAWTIEFHHRRHQAKVKVKKISDMSNQSTFLNGVVAIPGVSDAVLVSDSFSGLVGRLDLSSGMFDTSAFVFPEMAPISAKAFGVNGIKIRNNHLYFTNSNAVKIYRIAITAAGLPVKGPSHSLLPTYRRA
ncbi:hypothetical protein NW754_015112 [Fusarium falciforme]|nr:hypothetical protein NW754_015112 [Fusarium falciforme]